MSRSASQRARARPRAAAAASEAASRADRASERRSNVVKPMPRLRQRLADVRRIRDESETNQRADPAGRHAQGACGEHAGAGSVALLPRLPAGCGPVECCGCCLGGAGGAEAAQKQRQPLPQIYSNGPTVRILCKQVINSPKSRSKCAIRIWFRRPSAARSKCRKFEFNVSAR
jgi:hypothetical protein